MTAKSGYKAPLKSEKERKLKTNKADEETNVREKSVL